MEKASVSKSVLLVEDDAFLSEIYSTRFRKAGYDVSVAEDGEEALLRARNAPPRVILLDLVLPKRNGFSVLEALKADEELKSIPVVVLSNLGEPGDIARGKALGAAGYIVKAHFTPTEVLNEVERILSESEASKSSETSEKAASR